MMFEYYSMNNKWINTHIYIFNREFPNQIQFDEIFKLNQTFSESIYSIFTRISSVLC